MTARTPSIRRISRRSSRNAMPAVTIVRQAAAPYPGSASSPTSGSSKTSITATRPTIPPRRVLSVFIDTPGLAYGDLEYSESLAHFLTTRGDIDTHLVLPASMKATDLSRMVDAFEILHPGHLLFTKLDEPGSYGPIFGEAARTGKPLSFFTTGQRIPEDLEAASPERVLDLVLHGAGGRARSAA